LAAYVFFFVAFNNSLTLNYEKGKCLTLEYGTVSLSRNVGNEVSSYAA